LIPPNLFIVLAMNGVVLAWRTKRLGLVVATASISCLYLLSMPVVAYLLIRSTEEIAGDPPALRSDAPPGAIVVLSVTAGDAMCPENRTRSGR
jgi:hypothetical protein